jgi:hypothetical protein
VPFQVNRWNNLTWIPVCEAFLPQMRKDIQADATIEDVARYVRQVEATYENAYRRQYDRLRQGSK